MLYKCHQCGNEHSTENMVAYCACCVAKLQERVAGEYRDMKSMTMTVTIEGQDYVVWYDWSKPIPVRTGCSNDKARPAEGGFQEVTRVFKVVHPKSLNGGRHEVEIEPDDYLMGQIVQEVKEYLNAGPEGE